MANLYTKYDAIHGLGGFKYVTKQVHRESGRVKWRASVLGRTRMLDDEREAAKWVDLKLIEHSKEPVNILKRKVD